MRQVPTFTYHFHFSKLTTKFMHLLNLLHWGKNKMFHYTNNCTLNNLHREWVLGSMFPFSHMRLECMEGILQSALQKMLETLAPLSPQEPRLFIPAWLQTLIYKNIQIYMKTFIFLLSFTYLNTSCLTGELHYSTRRITGRLWSLL